ncbi:MULTISPECIES: protealysin inhibitor emfourin [unclassified Nocardia]|uniref:protealysin inhibitor emfourin n=1 Tax=unclassified Nocardia TaxID=2637762 RepID=UPI001CE4670B|nr:MULTISPECIES: protealysin inhibitor emfourin [unclassified Nocardia]
MQTSEKPSDATPPAVVRVELNQTGGLAGVDEVYTVDSGVADQRRDQLFDMVAGQQFRTLKQTYSVPNKCRDQFFYRVTVTYSDSTTKEVSTDDCSQSPQLLTDVRTLIRQIGVHHNGK